ncbi:MAG: LacI family DNA-binding transcriptional regulator [Armatimonadetes bacterium]|nr:LacI family DNA-binding transcriptional regulator [Anaerolineae bacterium]
MATMKQVADVADVSVATVSRVINKTGYVSPDLEVRVQEAMRNLKYQPSALARSLRRQQTQTIGVLIPQLDLPFFSTLAYAIEKSLFPHEYRTLICSAEENDEKETAYTEILLRQRVDGVIVAPTGRSANNLRLLGEKNVPVVLVDRDLPELDVNRVLVSNWQGAHDGMTHLLQLGHRLIGVVGAPAYSPTMITRIEGAMQALRDFGLMPDPALVITGTIQQFEMGYQAAQTLLQRQPRPTAIFALTDVAAIGVMHAAAEAGLRLPQDLSVVGFDDIPLASFSIPTLTSVAQPIAELGEVATRLLLSHISDRGKGTETIRLQTRLMVRGSTAALG